MNWRLSRLISGFQQPPTTPCRDSGFLADRARLDRAHQVERDRVLHLRQQVALEPADAVLRRNRAADSARRSRARRRSPRPSAPGSVLVRADRLGDVEVQVAVAEMAERQRAGNPGTSSLQRGFTSAMKRGTRDNGSEMSCLIEPPSMPLRLGQRLAQAPQRRCAGRARCASVGVQHDRRPPWPSPSNASHASPSARRRQARTDSISTYHGCGAASGSRSRDVRDDHVDAEARHQLEGGDARAARWPWRSAKQVERGLQARHADERRHHAHAGRGNSFSTAAVMMPSVPSEPMKRWLAGRSRCCPCAACRARSRCGRRPAPPRAPAPDRARCHRRSTAVPPALVQRLPPIVQVPSEARRQREQAVAPSAASCARSSVKPASTVMRVGERVDLADAVHAGERQHDLVAGVVGIWPPTRPVLPPWGTIRDPSRWQSRMTAETSAV